MRKFKHKPTGKIVIESDSTTYKIQKEIDREFDYIPRDIVESGSDFEEIFDDRYEILSFKHKGSGIIWKKDSQLKNVFCIKDGLKPFTTFSEINQSPKLYSIFSIKRACDGEIFTVGDEVSTFISKGKIKSFEIMDNYPGLYIKHEDISSCPNINEIYHKYPLFKTDDDFHIYNQDKYYLVKDDLSIHERQAHEFIIQNYKNSFKFLKNSEEYVFRNKKQYSIVDIENAYTSKKDSPLYINFIEALKKLS